METLMISLIIMHFPSKTTIKHISLNNVKFNKK